MLLAIFIVFTVAALIFFLYQPLLAILVLFLLAVFWMFAFSDFS